MGAETQPLIELLEVPRSPARGLTFGTLKGVGVAVATVGIGREKSVRRFREVLRRCHPGRVVNFGTCGSLGEYPVGAVLSVGRLFDDVRVVADLAAIIGVPPVALATVAAPVTTTEARERLSLVGAQVVDMELASLYTVMPLQSVKVVSDMAGADGILGGPRWRRPANILRFKAHATRLVRSRLVSVLIDGLRD